MVITSEIDSTRIVKLNGRSAGRGRYVLYWMQQSQREDLNHALEYAIQRSNAAKLPLVCCFGITDGYQGANLRHYCFMLEGLRETAAALGERGVPFIVRRGIPCEVAAELGKEASLIVCDRGYTRLQKRWRRELAAGADREVVQVESDVVVPTHVVSDKREYAARTFRPRFHRHLDDYLVGLKRTPLGRDGLALGLGQALDLSRPERVLKMLDVDRSVPPATPFFRGGTAEAKRRVGRFLRAQLDGYADDRSHPESDRLSHMSMYLHFGQISPIAVALAARESKEGAKADRSAFVEELLVRRELAHNFVEFTPDYDRYASLPEWARKTLADHRNDPRKYHYSKLQLERSETHDPYWNACMREMRYTGYMHNSMRMYWGKKILEWTKTPEHAYRLTLELNNRYFLDGRDPNSYANVGWIYGLHDRPWFEREIFGKVRYMSAGGLERKSDIGAYVRKVDALVKRARAAGIEFEE